MCIYAWLCDIYLYYVYTCINNQTDFFGMHICVNVHVCATICVHMCVQVCIRIYPICVYVYAYIIRICTNGHMRICVYVCVHVSIGLYI